MMEIMQPLRRAMSFRYVVAAGACAASAGATAHASAVPFDPWTDTTVSTATDPVALEDAASPGWRPEAFASFAWGDEGEVVGLHVGAEHWLSEDDRVAIAPQLTLGIAQNTDDDRPLLTGFDLQFRWYRWEARGWDIFLEAGAGVQYVGPESFPRRGTHANGRLRGGVGARYALDGRFDLLAGINWLHMSNANLLPKNNGHDGPMVYFGLTWEY
jgi:hypothetical protein